MKKLALMIVMVLALPAFAGDVSATSVTAQQRYPWNGLVDITVTIQGSAADVAEAECYFAATNSATKAALTVSHVTQNGADTGSGMTWTRKYIWNTNADVGEVKFDDVVLVVDAKILGGVQLWENGPYWAECNVGATKPEECGYYFWWGDTVGYKRNAADNGWVSVKDGSAYVFEYCPTYLKSISQLQSAGYIDSTGNLVAAHDAATAHLGAPWRMPTDAEFAALINNCDTEWTSRNGVSGRLVKGRGAYASKSIFLAAAGYGGVSYLFNLGSNGRYWSSTPTSGYSNGAWYLRFTSGGFSRSLSNRCRGQSVRPVRGFAKVPAETVVITFDANGGESIPSPRTVSWGQAVGTLPIVSRDGYELTGWFTAASGGNQVTAETVVSEDVTFFAQWRRGGVQLWENGPYWAECNVGASQPEECGYYFWWGDTVGYKRNAADNGWVSVKDGSWFRFSPENCPTCGKDNFSLQLAGYIDSTGNLVAAHDAATAHLGAPWRMPTDAEFAALFNNCDTEWTSRNGVSGRLVKGRGAYASKSIFLAAAGDGYDSALDHLGSDGGYWSSTPDSDGSAGGACYLYFGSGDFCPFYDGLSSGRSVRPVRGFAKVPAETVVITFDANCGESIPSPRTVSWGQAVGTLPIVSRDGYELTGWFTAASGGNQVTAETVVSEDVTFFAQWRLGGVQLWENGPYWAECNVGASQPEECGYYFWWGDTVGYKRNAADNGWVSVKDGSWFSFSVENCPTYGKNNSQLQSAGYIDSTGNLVAAHDAATAHLGAPWRMPTDAEFKALVSNCDTEWTSRNGVSGRLVKGRGAYSSKSIFLPAAGDGYDSNLDYLGSDGNYWSSTPNSGESNDAWDLGFGSGDFGRDFNYRYLGQSVRPVRGFAR